MSRQAHLTGGEDARDPSPGEGPDAGMYGMISRFSCDSGTLRIFMKFHE